MSELNVRGVALRDMHRALSAVVDAKDAALRAQCILEGARVVLETGAPLAGNEGLANELARHADDIGTIEENALGSLLADMRTVLRRESSR